MAINFNRYVEKMLDRIADRINDIHMALETALVRPDIDQWPRQIISDLYFNKTFIADPENNYLIEVFNDKIDEMDELTEEEQRLLSEETEDME